MNENIVSIVRINGEITARIEKVNAHNYEVQFRTENAWFISAAWATADAAKNACIKELKEMGIAVTDIMFNNVIS